MKQSNRVAIGGMITALSILCMFLTGVFPFATYALPAIAGTLIIFIVLEIGSGWATVVYIGISLLGLIVTPDRVAALMFIMLFGYYPIVKKQLERFRQRILEWVAKLFVFNASVIITYYLLIYVIKMPDVAAEFAEYQSWFLIVLLLLGNLVFILYDIALTRLISAYIHWFKPKYLKKLK